MRRPYAALILFLSFLMVVPAIAGQLKDVNDAYKRGDQKQATRLLHKYAEQGDAEAQYRLGMAHGYGNGVPKDYRKSAEWYQKSAEQGHLDAQEQLAEAYDFGRGVPRNYAEAAKWYLKVAEQGRSGVQCRIGTFYENGMGVRQDYAEAVKWYQEAAEGGQDRGMLFLGRMYEKGMGIPQDLVKAHMWYNLGGTIVSNSRMNQEWIDMWVKEFREDRDRVASKMTPAQITEAQRLAREWKPKTER